MADRHQFRAKWHDYNGGIYFITICCAEKQHMFGRIVNDPAVGTRFIASALGEIAESDIHQLPSYYKGLEIWNSVIMPNHIHMVLKIDNPQSPTTHKNIGCLKQPKHGEPVDDYHHNSRLSAIIGAFKAGVTRKARTRLIASLPDKIWQQRFHEHIIRNQRAFENIMNYIDTNVENWCYDRFNSARIDNASAMKNGIDNADAPWRVPTSERHEA